MNDLKERQLLLPLPWRGREFLAPAHAVLAGELVRYVIKRSARRRSISLRIDEEGLRVGAPVAATQRAIDNVLRTHAQWIVEKLAEWQQRHTPAPRWTDGDILMLRGKPVTLRLVGSAPALRLMGDSLIAPATIEASSSVIAWLREQALSYFSDRTAHFCGELALDVPHVHLSDAKTRWGSCHIAGRIHLNWRLIQMPLRLVDYVIAHEVAHLKEMNHSVRFWRVVSTLLADYAVRRKEIRREGHRYLVI